MPDQILESAIPFWLRPVRAAAGGAVVLGCVGAVAALGLIVKTIDVVSDVVRVVRS